MNLKKKKGLFEFFSRQDSVQASERIKFGTVRHMLMPYASQCFAAEKSLYGSTLASMIQLYAYSA